VGIFKRKWQDACVVLDNLSDVIYRIENTGYVVTKKIAAKEWIL
jgi:hypothetical protein